jgi:4-amino-4-deoxy-L-arabinose transferase-like glycosyltransferase
MPNGNVQRAPFAARLKFLEPAIFSNWLERSPIKPHWWVLILCALFILPAIFIRGTHYEEGTTIALARSIFEDHLWPGTFRYGERLIDRPHAVTWLLAGVGYLIGGMPVWVARIPTVLSLIGGAGLVYWLVRRYASAAAALFAVVCLIASPMMLQKTITAESDVGVSLLLFAAFVLFWRGYEAGGPTVLGWIGIAATVCVAGLWKGPQPLGYFFLGAGAFLLLRRQWTQFLCLGAVGMVAAAVVASWYYVIYQPGDFITWASHSRLEAAPPFEWVGRSVRFCLFLITENLPGVLLFVPFAWNVARRGVPKEDDAAVALILYASVCTLALLVWPGANGRYAMPATFGVAAAAGLAFDRLRDRRQWLVSAALVLGGLLVAYRLVLNWIVMPLDPAPFRREAILGQQVAAITKPPPRLLVSELAGVYNLLAYVPHTARIVPPDVISRTQPPYWAIVTPVELEDLRRDHPASVFESRLSGPPDRPWQLVEVRSK